jgi:hypothetical protein
MNNYKTFVELDCDNIDKISDGIYRYLSTKTDVLHTKKYGWHFINKKELLIDVPELIKFFSNYKLVPRDAAITIITENEHLPIHIDEPPVIAKINFPVLNTKGWANRWYDQNKKLVSEILDLSGPIVFNSQIPHSVEKTTAITVPRIVASFTFHNEPIGLLK